MSFATVVVVVCQVQCCVVDAWGTMKLRYIHGTPQETVLFPWGPQWNSGVPVVCPYLEQCHAVVALKDAFCLSLLRRIGSCRILQYQESNFLTFSCALFSREHSLSVYVCTACVFFEQSYFAVSKRHRIIACCVDLDFWMHVAV